MQIIVTLLELALVTRYNEGSWQEGRGAMNAFRWDPRGGGCPVQRDKVVAANSPVTNDH